jgi:hypothetical protein
MSERPTTFMSPTSLEGTELGAVCFVRDYVDLDFDGPLLRSFLGPIADANGERVRFPEAGSRDALCAFVGMTVSQVRETPRDLSIRFDSGTIEIPLGHGPTELPEAAHFVPMIEGQLDAGRMWIW